MIEQALVRTHTLLFSAAILLAVGCKDAGSPGSGVPGNVEGGAGGGGAVGGAGGGGGGADGAGGGAGAGSEDVAVPGDPKPAVTATAGEEAASAPDDSTKKFVECTTRTSMCTREFMPVCGKLTSGELRTYPNKCVACSDQAVMGYYANACEAPDEPPT